MELAIPRTREMVRKGKDLLASYTKANQLKDWDRSTTYFHKKRNKVNVRKNNYITWLEDIVRGWTSNDRKMSQILTKYF